ncbi:tetratricopeptide repeat protein [Micromonospora sonneratiae]|uniref:Tetratricopeptide repeat protein n=1 Tax=Micromonospora sonneratiae TaxID=1184706 RepID=A0ABW3YLV5_9ACTN
MGYGKSTASRWLVAVVLVFSSLIILALVLSTVFLFRQGLDRADKWAGVISGYAAAVTLLAAGLAWLKRGAVRRPQVAEQIPAAPSPSTHIFAGASLAAPTSDMPQRVRGRDRHLQRLRRAACQPSSKLQILAGLGGVGKSTIAGEMCRWFAQRNGRPAWWISAKDTPSLTEGLVGLAAELGANHVHLMAIRSEAPRARERLWELLSQAPPGWLLVFDNVDDPSTAGHLRDSGMARCGDRGLVLVTSRINQQRLWGNDAEVHEVELLAEEDAAQVLMDMAPDAGGWAEAQMLAHDLGYLPLALHLAGTNLASPFSIWDSFDDYRESLNELGLDRVLTAGRRIGHEADHRRNVMLTWEMSLTALASHGLPQCRPLLRMLSHYSAVAPIPARLLYADPIRALVGCDSASDALDVRRRVQEGLAGLADQSLITEPEVPDLNTRDGMVALHPVVAETNRANVDGGARTGATPFDRIAILNTAVELIAAVAAPLRFDDHNDWRWFGLLAPHVQELFKVADALDPVHLAQLSTATAQLVASYAWGGFETTAEALADRALNHANRLGGTHPATLHLRNERAWAIGRHGRWEDAHAELLRVRDARSQSLGAEHPDTLDTRHKLAWAVGRLGDWPAAEAQLHAVLDARVDALSELHPDALHSRCCLAWAVGRSGRPGEAERIYRWVIAAREHVLGSDHVETLDARHSLAELYVLDGRFRDAEQLLHEIIKIRVRLLGSRYPETLDSRPRYWLGRALHGQGRHRAAARVLRQLLDDQIRYLDPRHPATEATRKLLGRP